MAVLIELAETCARHFWRVLLVFCVVCGSVAFALLDAEEVHEARTFLLYKLGREYIYVPEAADSGARAPDPGDLQLVVNAEMQILNGSNLRHEVVERIGAAELYPDLAGAPDAHRLAVEALGGSISISLVTGSYVVRLAVRHPDPEMAARVANELVEVYFNRRREIFRTDDADFLRAQFEAAQAEVVALEEDLGRMLDGGDVLSFETARDLAIEEQRRLGEQMLEVEAALVALSQRARLIEEELAALEPMVVDQTEQSPNPVVDQARSAELLLEAERRALQGELGTGHPQVLAVSEEIEALNRLVESEPGEVQTIQRTTANPLWLQARADQFANQLARAEAEARRGFLVERLAQNRARLSDAASRMGPVETAVGKLELQREQVSELFTRLRDAVAREQIGPDDQTNIRIIERATPPTDPVGPPKSVRAIIAAFLGVLAALAYLVLTYFSRQTVQSAAGVRERLDLPVLGEVELRHGRRRRMLAA